MGELGFPEIAGAPERHIEWQHAGIHVPQLVEECSRMLDYAVNCGDKAAEEQASVIVEAREACATGHWDTDIEARLYLAKTALARAIQPVTADSLAPEVLREAQRTVRRYFRLTLALAIFLIPASMLMFLTSTLSEKSEQIIKANDPMALALNEQLDNYALALKRSPSPLYVRNDGTLTLAPEETSPTKGVQPLSGVSAPAGAASSANAASAPATIPIDELMAESPEALDIKTRLQEFARTTRELYGLTQWLARLNLQGYRNIYQSPWAETGEKLRENLELTLPVLQNRPPDATADPPTKVPEPKQAVEDARTKLAAYQDIRAASNTAQQASEFFWGAVATYLLPVLYAILGMMAYTLRDLCQRSVTRTYLPVRSRHVNRARLVIAIIIGTVISLFVNQFTVSGISASHLAIAFLLGGASDVFFAAHDRMVSAMASSRQ